MTAVSSRLKGNQMLIRDLEASWLGWREGGSGVTLHRRLWNLKAASSVSLPLPLRCHRDKGVDVNFHDQLLEPDVRALVAFMALVEADNTLLETAAFDMASPAEMLLGAARNGKSSG